MPLSALPEYLRSKENWKGTDDDVWYMRWRINLKWLIAYGPRATESWAKWRMWPKTIFAIRSKIGAFRLETERDERDSAYDAQDHTIFTFNRNWFMPSNDRQSVMVPCYLSAIQYWTRWHLAIQWPFHISFHCYFKKNDIPRYPEKPGSSVDNKLFFFRFGSRRDSDRVYWFPSLFVGLSWN